MSRGPLVIALALLLLAPPTAAHAATVSSNGSVITYTAVPGEANSVGVLQPTPGGDFQLTEQNPDGPTAPIDAVTPC